MEAAFFDLDKTVIAKASVPAFGPTLYNEGLINKRILLRAAVSQLVFLQLGAGHRRLEKMRRGLLQITRGWERARMEEIVREALSEVLEPIVYREALELIEEHQLAGRKVVIVSSSPEEIVRPLAEFLGVDDCISSRAQVDDNGRYTGEVDFYAYAEEKADAIRSMAKAHDIDLSASYAYSDSHTDVPMLEAVGHAVAVNPDKELIRVARANKWPIVEFTHPMPPSERAARRMRYANAITVANGAAALGLVYGYWKMRQKMRIAQGLLDRRR
jgi:HAD superfamily hydrolase (TIGR01490 family)